MEAVDPDPSTSLVGLPTNTIDVPPRDIDSSRFKTYNGSEKAVQMVPLDVAIYWYNTQKGRFVDARPERQYNNLRIESAAHSPAPEGENNDPLDDAHKKDRIVTYCTCPHRLSGIRASNLLESGYTGVYALGPGMRPWVEEGHQVEGADAGNPTEKNYVDDYSNVENND
jgi:rhodanese-related sulfurtransferase